MGAIAEETKDNPYQFTDAIQDGEGSVATLLDRMVPQFKRALPDHISADRMARLALTEIRTTPKLLTCDQRSLLGSLMKASQLGLEPGILGHCHLVPFRGEVKLIVGYRGLVDLARRSGRLQDIQAVAIYDGDKFDHEHGGDKRFVYRKELKLDRGKVYAYGAYARLKGGGLEFVVLRKDEVEELRQSIGKHAYWDDSPWTTHFDEMAKKTAIRALSKMLPMSTEFRQAEMADGQAFTVSDSGDVIDINPEDRKLQKLQRAEGDALDALGDAAGFERQRGETDEEYRARIEAGMEDTAAGDVAAAQEEDGLGKPQAATGDAPEAAAKPEPQDRRKKLTPEARLYASARTLISHADVDEGIIEEALASLEDYGLDGEELPEDATSARISATAARIATGLLEDAEATVGSWPESELRAVEDAAVQLLEDHARVESEQQRELALELVAQAPLESWRDKFTDAKQAGQQLAFKLLSSARDRLKVARELKADRLETLKAKTQERLRNLTEAASPDLRIAAEKLLTEEELERWEVRFDDLEDAAGKLARWALEKAEPEEPEEAAAEPSEIRQELDLMNKVATALEEHGLDNLEDLVATAKQLGPEKFENVVHGLGPASVSAVFRQLKERGLLEEPEAEVSPRVRASKIRRQVNAKIAKLSAYDKEGQLARAALEKMGDIKLAEFEGTPEDLGDSMADELIRQAREKIAENPEKLETERAAKAAQAAQAARKARDAGKGEASGEDGQESKPAALASNEPDYSENEDWKSLRQSIASSLGCAEIDDTGEKLTETERVQFYEAICKRRGVDALVELEPDAFEEEVEQLKDTKTKSVAGGLSQRAAYVRRTINEYLDV